MKKQCVNWRGSHYAFSCEVDSASESPPDFREVIICQMDDRLNELAAEVTQLKERAEKAEAENLGLHHVVDAGDRRFAMAEVENTQLRADLSAASEREQRLQYELDRIKGWCCPTCNGAGMIGGMTIEGGESEDCPDCSTRLDFQRGEESMRERAAKVADRQMMYLSCTRNAHQVPDAIRAISLGGDDHAEDKLGMVIGWKDGSPCEGNPNGEG